MENFIINNQFNIGFICTTQQCMNGLGDKLAMRWLSKNLEHIDYSFHELDSQSNRFANVLKSLGLAKGDVFFTFLPKIPEQFIAFLGSLKLQLITGTLFSNFGEEALLDRLGDSNAKALITKKSFLKKLNRIRSRLTSLQYIIVVDCENDPELQVLSYNKLMQTSSDIYTTPLTDPETPSVLHYTSGSTGKPKGVLHRHRSILHQKLTTCEVLKLNKNDIFWCTADQGWVTGTSYGIIGPWSLGITQLHFAGMYDPSIWLDLLEKENVTVWYTSPTALRMLMREDSSFFSTFKLHKLKHIFSVGEPLNPEVIYWARRTLDKDIYDTWWQTETGGIMISNRPGLEIRPGSMGKPVRGIIPEVLDENANKLLPGKQGNLCLKTDWPSMFITYLNNHKVYVNKFKKGFYYTGDTAYVDNDGYYWFMGRSDDIINTAGHLVSPFEIESALLEIEEVAESGVIGVPDELLFEKIVAYVNIRKQFVWSTELELKIRLHISNKVSSVATPQEVIAIDNIPKNKSGKIMRRVLKARYLGTDEGDISTLEI